MSKLKNSIAEWLIEHTEKAGRLFARIAGYCVGLLLVLCAIWVAVFVTQMILGALP